MKKMLFFITAVMILTSCDDDAKVTIDLDEYDTNLKKAFESKFTLQNEKIIFHYTNKPYTGNIEFISKINTNSVVRVEDGNIISLTDKTPKGEVSGLITVLNGQANMKIDLDTLLQLHCTFYAVKNSLIIEQKFGNYSEHDCDCLVEYPNQKKMARIKTSTDSRSGIMFSESKTTSTTTGQIVEKVKNYIKKQSDGTTLRVTLTDNYDGSGSNMLVYAEDLSVQKDDKKVGFSFRYTYDKNVFLHGEIENFNEKHCQEIDRLRMSESSLLGQPAQDRSGCVSEVLNLVSQAFKRPFTREELMARLQSKINNNQFLVSGSSDVQTYFE
ncbi:hypothetical protein [Emticicia fluvialis]|uniref:hypothetical protein n=1 Tax=Emticicia fluvialis TaxID=2974474 RepID=UPI00216694B0|nr:hypothetical protein [Emticicia fluvialis]